MADTKIVKGETATVEVRFPSIRLASLGHETAETITYTGVVEGRADYDDLDSVRITGSGEMPVRVIAFRHIVNWNGKPFKYTQSIIEPKKGKKKEKPEVQTVEVTGSKGDKYTLTINPEGGITCTCKGFGFKGKCSHIDKYKADHG
mgnify:CR=1 FL=1